jgi:hypothetical protein
LSAIAHQLQSVAAKADVAGLCIRTLKAITFDHRGGGGGE